jgi:3-deoxy-manno-octulosonate cytidylyltransferase (CMP-KDO synthetase)
MVRDLIVPFHREPRLSMGSVKTELAGPGVLADPNQGKVVCDALDFALTFTRLPVPDVPAGTEYFNREKVEGLAASGALRVFRTVGIYAYRREFLDVFTKLPPSPFERRERLEQLRALEHDVPVKVPTTRGASIEVNTPADLVRAEAELASHERDAREV